MAFFTDKYMDAINKKKMCPFLTMKGFNRDVSSYGFTYPLGVARCTVGGTGQWIESAKSPLVGGEYCFGGCGLIWGCCSFIIPTPCVGQACQMWSPDAEDCGLKGIATLKIPNPPYAAQLAQEYLYNEKIADDGKGIYGHTWTFPEGSRPPALENIPPKAYKIPAGVVVTEFKANEAVKDTTFSITVVDDQTGEEAVISENIDITGIGIQ